MGVRLDWRSAVWQVRTSGFLEVVTRTVGVLELVLIELMKFHYLGPALMAMELGLAARLRLVVEKGDRAVRLTGGAQCQDAARLMWTQ